MYVIIKENMHKLKFGRTFNSLLVSVSHEPNVICHQFVIVSMAEVKFSIIVTILISIAVFTLTVQGQKNIKGMFSAVFTEFNFMLLAKAINDIDFAALDLNPLD